MNNSIAFRCDECGRFFTNSRGLKMHLVQHKDESQKIACEHSTCDKKFTTEQALKKHLRDQHGDLRKETEEEQYPCKWAEKGCKKKFPLPKGAQEHARGCKFNPTPIKKKCPFCKGVFSPKYYYKHMKAVHKWSQ